MTHTAKNILIRAVKKGKQKAVSEIQKECSKLGIQPTLLKLLMEKESLNEV